ncbi:MAG TPA: dual specificity protein phosphatase [Nitrospira sp.]|nr:dual specificity protein phosphatase [Nitrospira sp.]
MYEITGNLLVGNIYDAEKPPATVGALLLVAEEFTIEPPPGLVYEKIALKEYGEAEVAALDRAISWVEQHASQVRVMVCCRAGMGRSVSIAIAYLCCVQGLPYPDAWKLVMTRRPGAAPLPNLRSTVEQIQVMRRLREKTGRDPSR